MCLEDLKLSRLRYAGRRQTFSATQLVPVQICAANAMRVAISVASYDLVISAPMYLATNNASPPNAFYTNARWTTPFFIDIMDYGSDVTGEIWFKCSDVDVNIVVTEYLIDQKTLLSTLPAK